MTLTFSRVTLAGPLWTVDDVKAIQLRITDAAQDTDVQEKLDAAEEWVLAYLGAAADETWTPATAPKAIKHAILMLTVHFYENRGDTLGINNLQDGIIWRELARLLAFYRDPGLG